MKKKDKEKEKEKGEKPGAINKLINKNVTAIASSASSIATIMNTSKGRDKICALIQTSANFFIHCIKYSNIDNTLADYNSGTLVSYQIGEKIKESMSKGRKIFKFLKFLQEVKGMQKNLKKKKTFAYKILLMMINIMNFFYYILDNILWAIDVGILSHVVNKKTQGIYKGYKNQFSLMKFILKIVKNVTNLVLRQRKENEILSGMNLVDDKVMTVFDDSYDLCRVCLKERRKKRFEILEIIISSMRIIPLTKSLKLPGASWMNPVFVSFCGWSSSILKILHMVLQRKSGDDKKEIKGEINEGENGEIDVKQFFSKTKMNLKSSKVRKKIQEKKEKGGDQDNKTSKNSSDSSSESGDDAKDKESKVSGDNTKNMMADFMRQSMSVKNVGPAKKNNLNPPTPKNGGDGVNLATGLRRRSVMVDNKNGPMRRQGVMTGAEKNLAMTHSCVSIHLDGEDKN